MPASAAASTSDMPFGTVASRPLIVTVTVVDSTVAIRPRRPPPRRTPPTAARPAGSPPAPPRRRSPRAPPARGPRPPRCAVVHAGTPRGTRSSHQLHVVVQARDRALLDERAAALVDVALELLPVLRHVARHRHRHGVPERTQALAENAVADVQEQVELALPGLAHLDAADDLDAPARPLPARRALAAALVPVELGDPQRQLHHARAVVDHD